MKLLAAVAVLLFTSLAPIFGQAKPAVPAPTPDVRELVSKATVAVYQGKQVCKYTDVEGWFGTEKVWGCTFVSHFTCTATVVDSNNRGSYIALTAGHCFDWAKADEYYISEGVARTPVLNHAKLIKFENDARYDYGILEFSSLNTYPVIDIDLDGNPPAIGTEVVNVNYSLGLAKQFTEGRVISGLVLTPANARLDDIKGRYLVGVGIGPGASGSAIVNLATGKIVGLVEAIFPGTQMPTVVIPTGKTFLDFQQDDSAGLKPLPQPPAPPNVQAAKQAGVWKAILYVIHWLFS